MLQSCSRITITFPATPVSQVGMCAVLALVLCATLVSGQDTPLLDNRNHYDLVDTAPVSGARTGDINNNLQQPLAQAKTTKTPVTYKPIERTYGEKIHVLCTSPAIE